MPCPHPTGKADVGGSSALPALPPTGRSSAGATARRRIAGVRVGE
jgi:hypothetical protein